MSADDKNQSKTIKMLVETEGKVDKDLFGPRQVAQGAEFTNHGQNARASGSKRAEILDRLMAANMLVPGSPLGQDFQDQYRRIKRPLLSNAYGKSAPLVEHGNLMLVTSSVPAEGKTFTTVNLALSIAQEKDRTVLLIDCDVARQGLSRMLGVDKMAGLVDVLENSHMDIGDALLQTDIEHLRILTAGKQDAYVTEMLSSQRMTEIVDEIVNRYSDRVIIIDGPPLLSTPQTAILVGLAGQVVFVVEAGKTSQVLVEEALELIPDEKATGIVMNKNQGLSIGGGYYGYYGYGAVEDVKK